MMPHWRPFYIHSNGLRLTTRAGAMDRFTRAGAPLTRITKRALHWSHYQNIGTLRQHSASVYGASEERVQTYCSVALICIVTIANPSGQHRMLPKGRMKMSLKTQ